MGSRNSIAESDQGRSFQAFYDFLLSHQRQAELTDLLDRLARRSSIIADMDERLARIHFDWIDASERTQATVRLLSDQLRRFLDDQVWLENRRVFDLLRSIEAKALQLRDIAEPAITIDMDDHRRHGRPADGAAPVPSAGRRSAIDSTSRDSRVRGLRLVGPARARSYVDRDELVRERLGRAAAAGPGRTCGRSWPITRWSRGWPS